MILSVSRRTDIPAYYPEWFMNRLNAGYVLSQNPMNLKQINRFFLSPQTVDCIVFWTKDPAPLLKYLDQIDTLGYAYYFQFTLTPYPETIERNLRKKSEIVKTFQQLSHRLGSRRIVWRYDPVLFAEGIDAGYHKNAFLGLCSALEGCTDTVVLSFVDSYRKIKKQNFTSPLEKQKYELAAFFAHSAVQYGIKPVMCCEDPVYRQYGIGQSSCIEKKRIEDIIECPIRIKPDRNQRLGCGCVESIDIGVYDTCIGGCTYCYATTDIERANFRYVQHDPASPLLFGQIPADALICEKEAVSARNLQLSLWE